MKKSILVASAFALALFVAPIGKSSGTGVVSVATASSNNSATSTTVTEETETTVSTSVETSVGTVNIPTSKNDIASAASLSENQSVEVVIKESTVPQADKTIADNAAKQVAENVTVAKYLDIKLNVLENNVSKGNVTRLSQAVRFVVSAPSGYDTTAKDFAIIRVHNGDTTVLPDLDSDPSTITFETDRFSTYAIAVGDKGAFDAYKTSDDEEEEDDTYYPSISIPAGISAISSSELLPGQTVKVVAGEVILGDPDKQAINAVAEKAGAIGVLRYIDITLEKYNTNGELIGKVTNLNNPVQFKIVAPEDGNKYDFAVVRLHAGKADLLKDLDSDPATITFESDRFSSYAIIYAAKGTFNSVSSSSSGSASGSSVKDNVPKTGDGMSAAIPAAVAVSFAAAAVVLSKKKEA